MNCSRFETLLTDYLDQTLDPPVRAALEQHISACPQCAQLLADVSKINGVLSEFPEINPSQLMFDRIIERTTGKVRVRSFWHDLIKPTLRPFATQRFAFATLMMFVFFTYMLTSIGPDFSALSFSDFRPAALAEQADRVSDQVYKRWMQVRNARERFVGEMWRLKEDVYGRLDYHLMNLLSESYQKSVKEKQTDGEKKK